MGDDTNDSSNTNSDSGTPNAATNEGSGNPSSSSSTASSTPEPKTQTVPTSTFKKIKQEHFDKGRIEGLAQANRRAQALGYKDYEDMANQVQASKANGTKNNQPRNGGQQRSNGNGSGTGGSQAQPQTTTRPESRKSREDRIRERQQRRADAERDRLAQEAQSGKTEAERLKLEKEELEAQLESERIDAKQKLLAHKCGVQDVDYAVELLRRHCLTLSADDLKAFDEREYFTTTLKKEKPYLYEATTQLATTGTGGGTSTEGGEGTPKASTKQTEPPPKKAIKDMTKAEYNAELARRGMTPPAL